jgi:molybdopterin molybdotransferase
VGDHDHVRPVLEKLGCQLAFWGVRMKPGYPLAFGTFAPERGPLVFGLPGNPVSAMVTFELFVRPALRRIAGYTTRLHRPTIRARAAEPIANPGSRRGYLRVTLARAEQEYTARLTGDQGSGILRSMVAADGLAVIPGDTTVPEGAELDVIVLRDV